MLKIIMIMILLFSLVHGYAEDNTATENKEDIITTKNDSDVQTQKPVDDPAQENKLEELPPDTFVPTEKLSEDISAPFPVDI